MEPGKDYQIVPFDRSQHTSFVNITFRQSIHGGPGKDAQFPWKLCHPRMLLEHFQKEMRRPGTVVLVAADIENPNVLLAWAACRPADNEVIFAFTGYEKRRFQIASALIEKAGVNLKLPTGLLFWTRAAQRIACKGRPLFFRCTDTAEPFTWALGGGLNANLAPEGTPKKQKAGAARAG